MRALSLVARGLLVAAAIRIVILYAAFWAGRPDVKSYHLEASATFLVIVAAVAWWAASRRRDDGPQHETAGGTSSVESWGAFVFFPLAALALYSSALPVGLLSDDFVLVSYGHDWRLGAGASYVFRPVSVVLWGLLDHMHLGVAPFHGLVFLLHGVVAWLTLRIASAWLDSARGAWLAAVLMLTFPVAVEPVVWLANGFENVVMAMFALMAVLVARRYGDAPTVRDRVLCAALAVAAVLSKETAAVTGVLILIDAWVRRALTRAVRFDAIALGAAGVLYGAIRILAASDAPPHEISKYTLQRTLFQTFGSLAQQWPATAQSLGVPVAVISVIALLIITVAAVWQGRRDTGRVFVASVAWSIVSVLPVFGWILIGPNLRDSRWVYLAAPAWAIGLAALVTSPTQRFIRTLAVVSAGLVIVLNVMAVRWQIAAWLRAGEIRDRVLPAISENSGVRACETVALSDLPENVDGAYVLLNGVAEALAQRGQPIRLNPAAPPSCRFRWDGRAIVPGAKAASAKWPPGLTAMRARSEGAADPPR
jgi:hypothetical protein